MPVRRHGEGQRGARQPCPRGRGRLALPGEQIACAQQNQPLAGGFASLEMPVSMPGQAQGLGNICYRHIGGNAVQRLRQH